MKKYIKPTAKLIDLATSGGCCEDDGDDFWIYDSIYGNQNINPTKEFDAWEYEEDDDGFGW